LRIGQKLYTVRLSRGVELSTLVPDAGLLESGVELVVSRTQPFPIQRNGRQVSWNLRYVFGQNHSKTAGIVGEISDSPFLEQ